MKVGVHVDDRKVAHELKEARKKINAGVRDGLRRGAERHGLPRAKALAPGRRIRNALRAGSTTRTAFLEVRTKDAPQAGLLEFGGTRRDVLRPKNAKALSTPAGPRAAVRGPRRYRAQRYMQRAVEQTREAVVREAGEAIAEVFEQAGLEVE